MTVKHLNFNKEDIIELDRLYTEADADGKETFMFKGHEVFTMYAKYMVEHGKTKFKIK